MNKKEIIKLFISTLLFFIFGFILNFTIQNFIEFKNWAFYFITRLITMVLSGTLLFFILNWKSLKIKNITFQTYVKWRGFFIVVLTLISIYFNRNGLKNRELVSFVLDKINKLSFYTNHEFIILNFDFVSQSISTTFFILVFIITFLFFEFYFYFNKNKLERKK